MEEIILCLIDNTYYIYKSLFVLSVIIYLLNNVRIFLYDKNITDEFREKEKYTYIIRITKMIGKIIIIFIILMMIQIAMEKLFQSNIYEQLEKWYLPLYLILHLILYSNFKRNYSFWNCIEESIKLNNGEIKDTYGNNKKNECELLCNDYIEYKRTFIEMQLLRLDILKYLVSPSVIIALISILSEFYLKETNLTLITIILTFVAIGIVFFLWNTYKKIEEAKYEEAMYKRTLYRIKNGISFTEKEKKDIINKRFMPRWYTNEGDLEEQ